MKMNEIKVGFSYSNGKGRIRRVIAMGPQYKLFDGQMCAENLRYVVVSDGTKKSRTAGEESNMTVASFARWAKEQV